MRKLPIAAGLQLILWHDSANGRTMRWAHSINEGGGTVDIAAQMKSSLKNAEDETPSND